MRKNEIYNLPLASFTFGKNDDNLMINSNLKLNNSKSNQFTNSLPNNFSFSLSNKLNNNTAQNNEINLNRYNSFHSSSEFAKNLKRENINIQNNLM